MAKENSRTKVVLSFDDGRKDNYRIALDVLKQKGIPATFNIATAYVDGSITSNTDPCPNKSMTIKNVIELKEQGFEIAGHGNCHQNTLDDIQMGLRKLRDWLDYSADQRLGFASPHCMLTEKEILMWRKELEDMGISYVRIGVKNPYVFYERVVRKSAMLTKSTCLYKKGFRPSLEKLSDQFIIYSIPVMKRATIDQVKTLVMEAVCQKKDCVLMFHSILYEDDPYYNDTWSWDRKKFEELCDWLVRISLRGRIKLSTTGDVIKSKAVKEEF